MESETVNLGVVVIIFLIPRFYLFETLKKRFST
jgi:hypothetical protein